MMSQRQKAFSILSEVFIKKHSLDLAQEHPWVKAICFGILKKASILDYILSRFSKKPLGKKDLTLKLIIYIGLYQLLYMDTKPHAAVFETVELAKKNHLSHASGFINALLQNIVRNGVPNIPIEATYNHPDWLLQKIKLAYPQNWQAIVVANNDHPPMFLRRRTPPFTVELTEPLDVQDIPGFLEGQVSVQDFAAQQAAPLLELQDGQVVLDACAAPGGKTGHILELAKVELYAVDQDEKRMQRVAQNLQRLGLHAHLQVGDASLLDFPAQFFDRILLDAPCSGTGVIRRHPDIRFLRRPEDIPALAAMQQKILRHLWPMLKPRGIFLYATCSILPEENDAVIKTFLAETRDAQVMPLSFDRGKTTPYGWQFLPEAHGPDGFYYAKLRKEI